MNDNNIKLPIPFSEEGETIPISFEKVCVILGANGVGKSRSLVALKENFKNENKRILYIEGGRVVDLPRNVRLDAHDTIYRSGTSKVESQIKTLGFQELRGRLRKALDYLFRKHTAVNVNYAKAIKEWKKGKTSEPEQKESKLDHVLKLFNQVFPKITVDINVESDELTCNKLGNSYNPSDLSDGEKQVLSILSDFAAFGDSIEVVIVDEPELNLNPSLAVRLWNVIESDLPETKFLYATHSIGFAIRRNVDSIYVLSSDNSAIEIDDINTIDKDELQHFLGAVPAILASEKALTVEGEDSSNDNLFYSCLVGSDNSIAITSVGSSNNVLAARHQNGLWNKIAGRVKIIGIVDRDFRSDEEISFLEEKNCFVLDLHELESYLCLPSIITN
ncbi:MAG: AAA family ATPase [Candidatus Paceibacterota bacterium]